MPIYENFPSKETVATVSQDGLMSKSDKAKLDGIEPNANNYVHPDDASTRHVTDTEKTTWNENTKFNNEMPTVISVGGIAAGTTFENMPVKDIFNKLFYPYVAPVVSCSSTPNGGVFEKGTSVSVSQITVSITKKSENITKVEIFDGGDSLGSKEDGQTGNVVFPLEGKNVTTDKRFTAKVTDASNKTVTAQSGQFTFVYPYYQGVIDDGTDPDAATVKGLSKLVQSKANKTLTYTTNNQKMLIAYPKSYGALSKIVDPNNFDVTDTWTAKEINIETADGVQTPYYLYTSKLVTVSSYKMQFNY